MPTIITHGVVGALGASLLQSRKQTRRLLFFSVFCPVLPDFDAIGFRLGIPYDHFFGHRGFSHSLVFALLTALVVVGFFFRERASDAWKKAGLILFFFTLTAAHGLLDALTSGGLGVALLAPFDNSRFFFPYTPIRVSPIGITSFFSIRGWQVLQSEFMWVWLPLSLLVIMVKVSKKIKYPWQ